MFDKNQFKESSSHNSISQSNETEVKASGMNGRSKMSPDSTSFFLNGDYPVDLSSKKRESNLNGTTSAKQPPRLIRPITINYLENDSDENDKVH